MEEIPKSDDSIVVKGSKKEYVGMLVIGILNNLPFWVAFSCSQAIVTHFNSLGFLGILNWGTVILGVFATSFNALLSANNVSHISRAIANGCFMGFGLFGAAFAPNIYVAIGFIALVGLSSDFGEGVMLGYFAATNNNSLLDAWGVGTGLSGFFGAGFAFLCQFYSIPYRTSMLVLCPSGLIYPLAFHYLIKPIPPKSEVDIESDGMEEEEEEIPSCSCRLWKHAMWYFINNGLVFFAQYNALSCFADCSMTKLERIQRPYWYSFLNMSYQIGGLLARATLRFFKVKNVLVLTILQLSFSSLWFVNVFNRMLSDTLQSIIMGLIGFVGGVAYINIFDQTMNYPLLSKKEREIITNYTSISIAGGILVSSMFTILMQNKVIRSQCIER